MLSRSIVYVANRLPWPLDDGWKRRTYAVLEGMAARWPVTMVAPGSDEIEEISSFRESLGAQVSLELCSAPQYPSLARTAWKTLISGRSPLSVRHFGPTLAHGVERAARRANAAAVVYAGSFLAEVHTSSSIAELPFVVDTHNIDSQAISRRARSVLSPSQLATRLVGASLHRAEARVFGAAHATLVCSPDEVAIVKAMNPNAVPFVVPNGVDTEKFVTTPLRARGHRLELLFFGHLDYPPNVDAMQYFAESIHEVLMASGIPFRLQVVGAGQAKTVRSVLRGLENVEVLGRVDDIARTIQSADAVIVPLRAGGGTRLKILEAMASGRVVVSTTLGAEGIASTDGQHLLIADTPSDFGNAIERIWRDFAYSRQVAMAAADLVRESYSWSAIQRTLVHVLCEQLPALSLNTDAAADRSID